MADSPDGPGSTGSNPVTTSNPAAQQDGAPPPSYEPPSIPKAWEFYNSCLPRRIKVAKGSGYSLAANGTLQKGGGAGAQQSGKHGTGYRLARPGETHDPVSGEPAVLYSIVGGYRELDEFGIGISLYFRQLMFLTVVIGACAAVNMNTISKNRDLQRANSEISGGWFESLDPYLQGSVFGLTRDDLTYENQGNSDIITCVILFAFVLLLKRFENKNIEEIDLGQQTPQDYSVRVRNLPTNVTDPDEYMKFFNDK